MASSLNLVYLFSFFFLLTTLQTHARDNYVFSKVSRNRDDTTLPSNTLYNNNANENEVTPSFEQQKLDEEQQPSFVPQTTHSNYGLYGHETTLIDNNYENQNNFNKNNENNNEYINENQNNYNNNENMNENVEYVNDENKYIPQLSESSYTNDVNPTKYVAQNDLYNNDNNNNNNENVNGNGEGKYYGSTRYNGRKNFYDVDGETKFDAYLKNMEMSYSKNYNNNNFNKNGKVYGNNYYNGNSMNQGYRNEFPQEEEFDFDDQP